MQAKILYISYDGMTDPLGQSQVLPYLGELSKKGFQITLLSFEKKARYNSEKKIIEKLTTEAGIKWIPLFFTSKPPILSKMYDRWNLLRKARQLHRKERFDIIHCRSYIAAEAGLQLKKKTGARFLFDMRGFWADEKVDIGQWDLKKLFYRKLYHSYKAKEKQFLLNADGIVSLTKAGKDSIRSKQEYKDLSIDVIPCCADLGHFDYHKINATDTESLRTQLGIAPGKKVLTYLGSIGGWYMSREMFAFYNQLIKNSPEYVLMILTKDNPQHVIEEAAAAGIPAENLIVRYAARSEVPVYLSLSEASIFFIRPTYSKTASSPTKHGELMGMGIPVICNDIGDTGNIIDATNTGIVIKEFSEAGYAEAIKKFSEITSLSKESIRQSAFRYFDLEKGAADYYQLYEKILNRSDKT